MNPDRHLHTLVQGHLKGTAHSFRNGRAPCRKPAKGKAWSHLRLSLWVPSDYAAGL